MGLDAALTIAAGALSNVSAQLALVSHNVANASTPGYVTQTLTQQSVQAGGVGMGVRTGIAQRDLDTQMQADLFAQNGTVSGLQTTATALQTIDTALGSPGQGNDLSTLVGTLQNDFTSLANTPDSQVEQQQVVTDAQGLASGMSTLSGAYSTARQNVQNDVVSAVGGLNAALATIGSLSSEIVAGQAAGQSTADLQTQRDAALQTTSQLIGARFVNQSDGSVLVVTSSGLVLPTNSATGPLATANATIGATASAATAGAIPPITLNGVDVTSQLTGGQIGADLTLRDQTLPGYQAQLDGFAQTVAAGFNAQGLTLFVDASGQVPAAGTPGTPTGFAAEIQVNPAVTSNPAAVRDGTPSQNAAGEAGYTGLISNLLGTTFGAGPQTLTEQAANLVAAQSQNSAAVTSQLGNEQSLQTTMQSTLQSQSGVNIDTQLANMVQLQNAYGANAQILTAVQSMWTTLLQAMPTAS